MKSYSAVVISAGYAGIGYGLCNDNVLILEKGEMPGSDFHSVLRPCEKLTPPKTEKCKKFFDFLRANSLIKEGFADALEMSLALCKYINLQPKKPEILLDAQLIEVSKEVDGFEVEYRTNTGIHTVKAKRVIDTSFLCDSARENANIEKKQLHIYLSNMPDGYKESISKAYSDVKFYEGFYENEAVVSFGFSPETTIFEAREIIEKSFEKAFNNQYPVIDMISFEFDVIATVLKKENIIWLPPHSFPDPIAAFDAGCSLEV
ncbi:MAG: hypothetical protein J6J39_05360 [Clostridia bacterium]|nr:hypothetical protein [Clostridia bacterium]